MRSTAVRIWKANKENNNTDLALKACDGLLNSSLLLPGVLPTQLLAFLKQIFLRIVRLQARDFVSQLLAFHQFWNFSGWDVVSEVINNRYEGCLSGLGPCLGPSFQKIEGQSNPTWFRWGNQNIRGSSSRLVAKRGTLLTPTPRVFLFNSKYSNTFHTCVLKMECFPTLLSLLAKGEGETLVVSSLRTRKIPG